jgi:hypothetical protein
MQSLRGSAEVQMLGDGHKIPEVAQFYRWHSAGNMMGTSHLC